MPKKTWFQHDMNCRKKEGLSTLLKVGGNEAYGMFWRLQELYMEMQIHKVDSIDSFIINEASLVKELGINRRRLPKVIELFSKTCEIVFQNICKTIGNVSYNNWHITLPKSLIFMAKRIQKTDNKSKSKSKKKKESKSKTPKTKYLDFVFLKDEEYQKLKNKYSQRFLDKCIEELDRYIPNSKTGKTYTDHYKIILGWVSDKIYEKHGNMPDPVPPPPEIPVEEMADPEEVRKLVEGVKQNILKPI